MNPFRIAPATVDARVIPNNRLPSLTPIVEPTNTHSTEQILTMQPDAIIEFRFKTTSENGLQGAIIGYVYGCPLFVDGEAFDCRIYLEGRVLDLGKTYEIGVKFLNPQLALPHLSPGKTIHLWEGKEIATGKVVRLGQ